ncbi:SHV3-like 5 [Artemisia annua]|uniref:glycerophosphodiester phosphodiesterase n=1 Tax=Artemisia annua TaxID=35608 RepID=A0A2U1PA23_ARTAN|nr:SHV3-like 5 [Artemisia annua]
MVTGQAVSQDGASTSESNTNGQADEAYVSGSLTETLSIMLDFYCDPYSELVSFIAARSVGVITNDPKTASAYIRNPCVDSNSAALFVFLPIKPGDYLAQVDPVVFPPASTPIPTLQVTDVVDPLLYTF